MCEHERQPTAARDSAPVLLLTWFRCFPALAYAYVLQIAGAGLNAVRQQQTLLHGLNTYQGYLTCQGVAESFALPYTKPEEVLAA